MANDKHLDLIPGDAAADLSAKQFYLVRRSGDALFNLCNGLVYHPAGILRNKPTAAEPCEVAVGYTPALLGATCTAGQLLSCGALGTLVPLDVGLPWGACARCEVGGVAGDIREVYFFPSGVSGKTLSP